MKKICTFYRATEASIRNNYYESMEKLKLINNISDYIDTSTEIDSLTKNNFNLYFDLYVKHFELIELFLINTLEDFTISDDSENYMNNKLILMKKGITSDNVKNLWTTIFTHITDICKYKTNKQEPPPTFITNNEDYHLLLLSGTVDSVSEKIELTNLNLFNYEVLNKFNFEITA